MAPCMAQVMLVMQKQGKLLQLIKAVDTSYLLSGWTTEPQRWVSCYGSTGPGEAESHKDRILTGHRFLHLISWKRNRIHLYAR
jgi:hypothetical protein